MVPLKQSVKYFNQSHSDIQKDVDKVRTAIQTAVANLTQSFSGMNNNAQQTHSQINEVMITVTGQKEVAEGEEQATTVETFAKEVSEVLGDYVAILVDVSD